MKLRNCPSHVAGSVRTLSSPWTLAVGEIRVSRGIRRCPLYTIEKRGSSGECLKTFELEEDEKQLRN